MCSLLSLLHRLGHGHVAGAAPGHFLGEPGGDEAVQAFAHLLGAVLLLEQKDIKRTKTKRASLSAAL